MTATPQFDPATYAPRHFKWRLEAQVGVVTLDRPERKNPLTFDSYAELRDFFRALTAAPAVRALVITGAGGNFCSGGDVHEIIGPLTRRTPAGLLEFTRMTGDVVKAMRACPQPIIAAVDGVCAGAGAILAMASDFRLGTPRAKRHSSSRASGSPDATWAPARSCPGSSARDAPRSSSTPAAPCRPRKGSPGASSIASSLRSPCWRRRMSLAAQIAQGPTFAHAMTKRMLHTEWHLPIDAAIDAEAEAQAVCMQTEDFRRAYRAFVAKQQPRFEGD